MATEKKCCVPGCGLDSEILHKFPNPNREIDRFRTWIYNVGGDILGKENEYIYKYRRVCHLHFEVKYHTRSKMLSANAVPTLKLSKFAFVKKPQGVLIDITNQPLNIPPATPSTSGLSYAEKRSLNVTYHTPNIPPATPSTSGLSYAEKRSLNVTYQTPNIPPATPSTSGQQFQGQVEPMDVDDLPDKTVQPVKSQPIKRKAKERMLLKKVKELQKDKDYYKKRLNKARKLSTNSSFQNTLKKFKTLAAIFTIMQFREISKPKMGRRFKKEEKIMALSLYKLGPRAYRWLIKSGFVLPSPVTLSRLVTRAGLKPGFNENIFNQLNKKASGMKEEEKLCTLIFDEMAITPHFDYNRKKDRITGFVNYEGEPIKKIADHVLVFMIRGIVKNYKQPIYYSFSAGSTPKLVLARLIKTIIKQLHKQGFTVLATVCDQGTSNTSAINYLIEDTKRTYMRRNDTLKHDVFEVEGKRVIPLYDVPHLLKGLRNNLIAKNLKYTMNGHEKIAKWEHIKMLYENNPSYKGLKLIKNLTENHCNKDKIPKMKVKYASQLFSQTVGKTMGYLAENGKLPEEAKDTADLIIFVDNLFDSMNGSFQNAKTRSGKDLLRNVTPNSLHKNVWTESKRILKSMKFVSSTGSAGTVPSINNWLHTVENMELLRDKLFSEFKIKSLWCRHLNQDPLENFFGSIRSHGIRNVSPTCAAFEAAFASLLVNNLSSNYAVGSNCEEDFCGMLHTFDEIFFKKQSESQDISEIDFEDLNDGIVINYQEKENHPIVKAQLEYVTGYLLRKCRSIIKNCSHCKENLFEKNGMENRYINCREYVKNKKYLTYPNTNMKVLFSCIQDVVHNILKRKSHLNNLKNYIKVLLHISADTNFIECPNHKKDLVEFFFDFSSRFFIYSWCKSTNKLFSGLHKEYDSQDSIQQEAVNYCNKRRKK